MKTLSQFSITGPTSGAADTKDGEKVTPASAAGDGSKVKDAPHPKTPADEDDLTNKGVTELFPEFRPGKVNQFLKCDPIQQKVHDVYF